MAGPSWLAGTFAAVMILTAAYSASRLAVSRLRGQATEFDADALHAVMGAAMAGMLVPRLNVLPDSVWVAVFGIAAAWFGWHALRAAGLGISGGSPCRFPVPHLIECVAMLYMLLPVHGPRPAPGGHRDGHGRHGRIRRPGGQLPGARGCPRPVHARLHRVDHRPADRPGPGPGHRGRPGRNRHRRPPAAARAAAPAHDAGGAAGTPAPPDPGRPAVRPVLAPKLAACGKLAMSITMGYMLILML